MHDLQPLIASAVPGRLRLRGRSLRHAGTLARLRQHLHACPGVDSLHTNSRVGSVLLHYDPARLAPAQAQARVSAALHSALQAHANSATADAPPAAAPAPARTPRPRSSQPARSPQAAATLRVPLPAAAAPQVQEQTQAQPAGKPARPKFRHAINRGAKIGMLLSLSASLVLAATGAKRAHIASGTVFLVLLCVHLTLYRKRLLK